MYLYISRVVRAITGVMQVSVDFLFSLAEFIVRLAYIVLIFMCRAGSYFSSLFLKLFPIIYSIGSFVVSILVYIATQIVRGLFGLEDRGTNTLSWIIFSCLVYLYLDRKYDLHHLSLKQRLQDLLRGRTEDHQNTSNSAENQVSNVQDIVGPQNEDIILENVHNENRVNDDEETDTLRNRQIPGQLNANRQIHHLLEAGLRPEEDETQTTNLCIVCMERERNVAVFPCGHTHLCMHCVCLIQEESRLCPMCQKFIHEYREIFL